MQFNPSYYSIIPADVRYDNRLKSSEKLLYGEITSLCTKEGYCWANNSYFSRLYDVHNITISHWITNLRNLGYINIDIEQNKGNLRKIYISNHLDLLAKTLRPLSENAKHNNKYNNKINIYTDDFNKFWSIYPKRSGDNPKKSAFKSWNARLKDGNTIEEIISGTKRYLEFCKLSGQVNTPYVKQAKTFLGPDECFKESWEYKQKQEKRPPVDDFIDNLMRMHNAEEAARVNGEDISR